MLLLLSLVFVMKETFFGTKFLVTFAFRTIPCFIPSSKFEKNVEKKVIESEKTKWKIRFRSIK